jgi:hypothetical protein
MRLDDRRLVLSESERLGLRVFWTIQVVLGLCLLPLQLLGGPQGSDSLGTLALLELCRSIVGFGVVAVPASIAWAVIRSTLRDTARPTIVEVVKIAVFELVVLAIAAVVAELFDTGGATRAPRLSDLSNFLRAFGTSCAVFLVLGAFVDWLAEDLRQKRPPRGE